MDLNTLGELQKPSKTFKKWLDRVKDHETPWTENDIIFYRKYVGCNGSANKEQKQILKQLFESGIEYSITQDQTEKGLNYIKNKALKKNGKLRNTKNQPFGNREVTIIKNFKEFKFVGLYSASRHNDFTKPIYKVIAKNGMYFEYIAGSFGDIEVIG